MSLPFWNGCTMLTWGLFPGGHLLITSSLCHKWSASTFSYGASLAGDDRSISSSSSEASHSDNSLGSRLAIWPELVRHPTPVEPSSSASSLLGVVGSKSTACSVSTSSDERLYGAMMGGLRPPSKPPHPRGLQEAGRQSSTDSGIATGSHSSYSGSFSSYTGSMDIAHGDTDEFGSLTSLPQNPNLISNSLINTPVRTFPLIPEHKPCVCPLREAAQMQAAMYQVPNPPQQHYDVPRRVLQQQSSSQEQFLTSTTQGQRPECGALGPEAVAADETPKQTVPQRFNWCGEGAAPPEGSTTPQPQPAICPDCGGGKVTRFVFLLFFCLSFCERFRIFQLILMKHHTKSFRCYLFRGVVNQLHETDRCSLISERTHMSWCFFFFSFKKYRSRNIFYYYQC